MKTRIKHALAAAGSLTLAATAAGQNATSGAAFEGLEEIVVTSRRIEESLQTTPISVSAFQASDLEELHIERIGDVAAYTPNFSTIAGPTGHNDAFFFIRGIGQTDLNAAADPAVGVYIDGVYLGRVVGASFDSLDIARIEVLRGPQGTLFGRNTMGGALSVTTADPGDVFTGQLVAGAGERDRRMAKLSLGIPLTDSLGVALSGMYLEQDGWSRSIVTGKTFDDVDDASGRIKFLWTPNDALDVRLGADVSRSRGTSQNQRLVGVNTAASSPLRVPLAPQIADDLVTDPFLNKSSIIDPRYDVDTDGVNLTIDWRFGDTALKSISAFRQMEQAVTSDFDGSRVNFYQSLISTDQEQFSQELQLTGEGDQLQWLLGAYYFDESAYHNNAISLGGNNGCRPTASPFPYAGPFPVCGATPYASLLVDRVMTNNQQFDLDVEALALFAHASWKFSERLSASLGLRWTDEEKTQAYDYFVDNSDGVANVACRPPGAPNTPPTGICFSPLPPGVFPSLSPRNPALTVPSTYTASWSDVTPKLGLEFQANDATLWYASYSEGFKSGGFNGRVQPNVQTGQFGNIEPYAPEHLKTIELGWKAQLADDRVRLNGAVFASAYEDIQLLVLDAQSGFFDNTNAGEAEIYGVELDFLTRPTAAFEFRASVGYIHHEYTELDPRAVLSGITFDSKLPGTPEWSASLGAQYTWTLGAGDLALRADYSYRSEVVFNAVNGPLEGGDDVGLLNARASYTFGGERWSISVYLLNATDELYVSNGQDVTGALGVAFNAVGPPREWGAELAYRFGR